MQQHFEAVYENGLLRPLTPVSLYEHQRVTLTLSESAAVAELEIRTAELPQWQPQIDIHSRWLRG